MEENLELFTEWLKKHTRHKAELYDGWNSKRSIDEFMRFAVEELGEVSSAVTRERWELAMAECIDLAHCAFLIFDKIKQESQ